jgi:hypothetical protein
VLPTNAPMNPVQQQLCTEIEHTIDGSADDKRASNVRDAVRWRKMSEHEKLQAEEKMLPVRMSDDAAVSPGAAAGEKNRKAARCSSNGRGHAKF